MTRPGPNALHFTRERLLDSSPSEKRKLLDGLMDGFLNEDITAAYTAYSLGDEVIRRSKKPDRPDFTGDWRTPTAHGNFSAAGSLAFVHNTHRTKGFIGAIKRWDEQEAVIDVGCGSFPVLALAAAAFHKKADIQAIEINSRSAEAAKEIVKLFGLSDRIEVINSDIINHPIDTNTTGAVTETFNSALALEPGPIIVKHLHQAGVPTITPSFAELKLQLGEESVLEFIDLREDTHANFTFDPAALKGLKQPALRGRVSAAYYDEKGLVLDFEKDIISGSVQAISAEQIAALTSGDIPVGTLTYELGSRHFAPCVNGVEDTPIYTLASIY